MNELHYTHVYCEFWWKSPGIYLRHLTFCHHISPESEFVPTRPLSSSWVCYADRRWNSNDAETAAHIYILRGQKHPEGKKDKKSETEKSNLRYRTWGGKGTYIFCDVTDHVYSFLGSAVMLNWVFEKSAWAEVEECKNNVTNFFC